MESHPVSLLCMDGRRGNRFLCDRNWCMTKLRAYHRCYSSSPSTSSAAVSSTDYTLGYPGQVTTSSLPISTLPMTSHYGPRKSSGQCRTSNQGREDQSRPHQLRKLKSTDYHRRTAGGESGEFHLSWQRHLLRCGCRNSCLGFRMWKKKSAIFLAYSALLY